MKFTVVSLPAVDDALTELWLNASNPQAVTAAADWIERQLKSNPLSKVTAIDNLISCGVIHSSHFVRSMFKTGF